MDIRDFDALEQRARQIMLPGSAASVDAGADDSISTRENVAAWRALRSRDDTKREDTKPRRAAGAATPSRTWVDT